MKKEELFEFLSKSFEGKSRETVSAELEKIQTEWLAEYRRQCFKGYMRCRHCGCYSRHNEFIYQEVKAKETLHHKHETDIYAVKRGVYICPKCGKVTDSIDLEWNLIGTQKHE